VTGAKRINAATRYHGFVFLFFSEIKIQMNTANMITTLRA
jgi:hypothetical protein